MKAISKIFIVVVLASVLIFCVWFFSRNSSAENPGTSAAPNTAAGLVISELMASNGGILPDNKGNYSDWAELYNGTGSDVNLSNCSLTNDEKNPAKYPLPNVTLPAGSYLIVFFSGDPASSDFERNAYHANFKLSASKGGILTLYSGETVLDKVTFEYMDKNISLTRMDSDWQLSDKPTPGFPNNEEGYLAFKESRIISGSPIILNEIMTSNNVTIVDEYGNYNDYVEITNRGDTEFNLEGFGLSDNPNNPMKFRFPSVSLKPGEYLLVYCCGELKQSNDPKILFAPFRISAYRATVGLYDAVGMQLDLATIEEISADSVFARTFENGKPSDTWQNMQKPSPLYSNDDNGYNEYLKKNELSLGDLIISEVLASNAGYTLEDNDISYDYIKLHNRGNNTIDLSGYSLTTNPKNPGEWRIPDGVSIAPGEYKVFLSSDLNNTPIPAPKYTHTNFRISKDGEIVVLRDNNDNLLDKVIVDTAPKGATYGRDSSGALCFFLDPSPNGANGQGYPGYSKTPVFSQIPGVYDETLTIELSSGQNETIYYTLDCSEPSESSTIYSAPITVDKNTVIRAFSKRDGYIKSPSVTGTYLIGVSHSLPIISLVSDKKNLFDPSTGIYSFGPDVSKSVIENAATQDDVITELQKANFYKSKPDVPGCIEVFDENDKQVFSQNIDLRLAGAFGRFKNQKGFTVTARTQYGDSRLRYPFFEDLPYTEYKAITFRAGGQDQSSGKLRDEIMPTLLKGADVNVLYQTYEICVVYLNGEYWGSYAMKEKRSRFFVAQHENADPDKMDLIHSTSIVNYGSNTEWNSLMSYLSSHDASNSDVYNEICSKVDVDSFIDFMVCEIYGAKADYSNIQFYRLPGGKWKWITYDYCWSWGSSSNPPNYVGVNHNTLTLRRGPKPAASDLLNALLENSTWRDKFIRRMGEMMKTVFTPEKVLAAIDELYYKYEPEIKAERAKFNQDTFMDYPTPLSKSSYDTFASQVEKMRDFAQKRPQIIKNMFKSEFNLSEDYMKEVFG